MVRGGASRANGKTLRWKWKAAAHATCGSLLSRRYRNRKKASSGYIRARRFLRCGLWTSVRRKSGARKRFYTLRRRAKIELYRAMSKFSAKAHSESSHWETHWKPFRRAIPEMSFARYLCELSVQIVS